MEAGSSGPTERGYGYSGAAVAGALLGTLFFPLISLIAALVLQGGQTDPQKRSALRTWAWVSGGWMVLQVVVFIALAGAIAHSSGSSGIKGSGPCVGGPKTNASGKDISGNGTKVVFSCEFGGTATVTFTDTTPSP